MQLRGSGLGYRRDIAQDILNLPDNSVVQFIEVAPENWAKMGGAARRLFDQAAERFPVAIHGLSLSLGGQAPLDRELLSAIKTLMKQYHTHFFSDHLSFCEHQGHLYDLLPLPFNEEAVHHTAQRIAQVQDFLGTRISLENTSYYYHSPAATMNEVQFLNAIAQEADCGIHLDVNNIYVNHMNHGLLAPKDFIDAVDAKRVNYIHIAGYDEEHGTAEEAALLIDTHGESVREVVWDLLAYAYQKLPHLPPTLLERDFNFPAFSQLLQEVQRIQDTQRNFSTKPHWAEQEWPHAA